MDNRNSDRASPSNAQWGRWSVIEPIFDAVLDLPPAERAVYLDSVTTGDPELRKAVESLLASIEGSAGYLSRPAAAAYPALFEATTLEQERSGTMIGPYRLVREAGHGGMGTVYVAERADDQYQGRVALKVLRGNHDPALVRRFLGERQILATLTHPRIARLYDGGLTADGQPWFAMELVEGTPLTAYCDGERKSIEERLRLFVAVCGAVAFAHRNLVVHRDLKPSNILVNAAGEVTLLDFGIAKVLGTSTALEDGLTLTGQQLMTPDYASPEQVRGDAITTATDVYSLGVVLCELLCGARPHARNGRPLHEVTRAVLEDDPESPSVVIARAAVPVLESRRGTRRSLTNRLRGDLDTIVLKALEKQVERRYNSVEQFASDVTRWLDGLPILARPATPAYRAAKLIRRHPLGVAATTIVLLLLVSFATITRVQLSRVERERASTQEISDFLSQLFLGQNPLYASESLSARNVLDTAAARLSRAQRVHPAARAHLLNMVGFTYWQLGERALARPLLDSSISLYRQIGAEPKDFQVVRDRLYAVVGEQGLWTQVDSMLREELAFAEREYGMHSARVISARNQIGETLDLSGHHEEAYAYVGRTVEIVRSGPLSLSMSRFVPLRDLGTLILNSPLSTDSVKLREAETALNELAQIDEDPVYRARPSSAPRIVPLARVRFMLGDTGASKLIRESIATHRKVVGDNNYFVDYEKAALADMLADQGALAEAESLYREIWPRQMARVARGDLEFPNMAVRYSRILLARGTLVEAESMLRRALPVALKYWPSDGWQVGEVKAALGVALARQGRHAEAKPLLVESASVVEYRYGPNDHLAVAARSALESITKPRKRR